ncbi:hypothetical protein IAU59_005815 [Kwoniella sp. CBS 9459]
MAALAASAMHAPTSVGSSLSLKVDQIQSATSSGFNVMRHRDEFQEKALRDVTMNSNDSAMMLDPSNPLLVREEMQLQKEYVKRLKFTHIEQEAKRHFLASVMGDDPPTVQPGQNEELEAINAEKKAALKTLKTGLYETRDSIIRLAEINEAKHAQMTEQLTEAQAIQKQIRDMELELARIKATHPPEDRLTTAQANEKLDHQIEEIQDLTDRISTTQSQADSARDKVAKVAKEVQRLGREREREEGRAKEVREGREAGDTKVDEVCRWLTSSMTFYKSLLGIKSIKAVSDNELHMEYDVPHGPVTLALMFDEYNKRFIDAHLLGSNVDISEPVGLAAGSNDVPGLIADVLVRLRPA